jgi:hypothetical protein
MQANMTFKQWLKAVDLAVLRLSGVSLHELADQPWRDWYDDDMNAEEAAREALAEEGFFSLTDGWAGFQLT